jgi:hypothetical protein
MSLAPYSCSRYHEHTSDTHTAKVVPGEEGNGRETLSIVKSNGHSVGGHERASCCTED